jgi:hypothetical protein
MADPSTSVSPTATTTPAPVTATSPTTPVPAAAPLSPTTSTADATATTDDSNATASGDTTATGGDEAKAAVVDTRPPFLARIPERKVRIHFRSTGNAPVLRTSKFSV